MEEYAAFLLTEEAMIYLTTGLSLAFSLYIVLTCGKRTVLWQ